MIAPARSACSLKLPKFIRCPPLPNLCGSLSRVKFWSLAVGFRRCRVNSRSLLWSHPCQPHCFASRWCGLCAQMCIICTLQCRVQAGSRCQPLHQWNRQLVPVWPPPVIERTRTHPFDRVVSRWLSAVRLAKPWNSD